jgi:hypothetical protein
MSNTSFRTRTRLVLLILGAITGLVLAGANLVERWSLPSRALPEDAIAQVGDRLIPQERYQQLLHDLATDKRTPLSDEDRQFVLDRLIDEELLIMRGVELRLVETSPEIRKAIASNVIMQVVAEAQATVPDEVELHSLFESDPGFFVHSSRYRVIWWRLDGQSDEYLKKALDTYQRPDEGAEKTQLLQSLGFARVSELPDTLLPMSKLIDYMGPALADQVTRLQSGRFSHPIDSYRAVHILHLAEQDAGSMPPFEDVRPVVEAEYQRRKGDRALRDYLSWLRKRTKVMTVERGQ